MKSWCFYDLKTGLLNGNRFSSSDHDDLALNMPEGCGAVEGHHDHHCLRVDLATGDLVDHQPPAPSHEHEWNEDTKRWQLTGAAQAKIDGRSHAVGRIAQLEASQHRALRELALGSTSALARLQSIDAEILNLRPALT